MWKQHELTDGTYDFQDLIDIHAVLDAKEENECRVHEYIESIKKSNR